MSQIKIRPLQFEDRVPLMAILRSILQGPRWGFSWTEDSLLEELKHSQGVVLLEAEVLKAFLIYRKVDSDYEIMTLGTDPQFQGKGLMEQLMRQVLAQSTRGANWRLEVHAKNLKALRLYQSLGFQEVRRRSRYYPDQGDALEMALQKV